MQQRYRIAGEPQIFTFDLTMNGDFVVPDVGTVTYTLRAANGTPLVSASPIITTDTQTQVQVPLVASLNTKVGVIEKRSLQLDYQVDGHPQRAVQHYWLIDWPLYSATPADVRAYIGINDAELRDDDIDLNAAYLALKRDLGALDLDAAFQTGDSLALVANNAVVYQAVLTMLPGLQFRVAQKEQDDTQAYTRLKELDFEALRRSTVARLSEAKREILGEQILGPTLFVVANVDDPIVGDAT